MLDYTALQTKLSKLGITEAELILFRFREHALREQSLGFKPLLYYSQLCWQID